MAAEPTWRLLRRRIVKAAADEDLNLLVVLDDGAQLSIDRSDQWEAWQLHGKGVVGISRWPAVVVRSPSERADVDLSSPGPSLEVMSRQSAAQPGSPRSAPLSLSRPDARSTPLMLALSS